MLNKKAITLMLKKMRMHPKPQKPSVSAVNHNVEVDLSEQGA